jgi:hypothetical protein
MPEVSKVKTYKVYLTRERDYRLNNAADHLDFDEWMFCLGDNNNQVRIYFLLNETIPKSFASANQWYAFMPAKHYVYALDLLRNETPVTVWLDKEKGQFIIYTGAEPVGEGPGEKIP